MDKPSDYEQLIVEDAMAVFYRHFDEFTDDGSKSFEPAIRAALLYAVKAVESDMY